MSQAPSRPKRSSAKATADKINASLKAESAKIDEQRTEPPPRRTTVAYAADGQTRIEHAAGCQEALHDAKKRVMVPKAEAAVKAEAKIARGGKAGKRPVATISLLDDDDDGASAGKRPLANSSLPAPKAKRVAPSKAAATAAGADNAADAGGAANPNPSPNPEPGLDPDRTLTLTVTVTATATAQRRRCCSATS